MKLGIFHFQLLYDVLTDLHFIYDEKELAKYILSKVSDALNSEAGTLFHLKSEGVLYPLASYGVPVEKLRQLSFHVGVGVVGWVMQYMQPIKVEHPEQDPRFYGGVDKVTGFKTKSIIAAPVVAKNKPLGVIQFLNRRDRPFAIQDLELISMLGREIGIALEHIRLIKEIEKNRALREAVTNSLFAGILVIDPQENLLEINPRAKEILQLKEETIQENIPIQKVLANYPSLIKICKEINNSSQILRRSEITIEINQEKRHIGYSGVPVIDRNGNRLGSAVLFQDITTLKPND